MLWSQAWFSSLDPDIPDLNRLSQAYGQGERGTQHLPTAFPCFAIDGKHCSRFRSQDLQADACMRRNRPSELRCIRITPHAGPARTIRDPEQIGQPVPAMHRQYIASGRLELYADTCNEQGPGTSASRNFGIGRRPTETRFRNPDYRHPALQPVIQTPPETGPGRVTEIDVTIDNDCFQRKVVRIEQARNAG